MHEIVFDHFQLFKIPNRLDYEDEMEWKVKVNKWSSMPSEIRSSQKKGSKISVTVDPHVYNDLADINAIPTEFYFSEKIKESGLVGVFNPKDISVAWMTLLNSLIKSTDLNDRNHIVNNVKTEIFNYDFCKGYFDNFFGRVIFNYKIKNDRLNWCSFYSIYSNSYGRVDVEVDLDCRSNAKISGTYSNTINIIYNLVDDFRSADDLWREARGDEDIATAIGVAVRKRVQESGEVLPKIVHISKGFFDSLGEVQGVGGGAFSSVCYQKVMQAVFGEKSLGAADFKVSKDSKNVRVYKNYKGKRAHVTKNHEALRLMYWESASSIIIDCVRKKSDIQISNPTKIFSVKLKI